MHICTKRYLTSYYSDREHYTEAVIHLLHVSAYYNKVYIPLVHDVYLLRMKSSEGRKLEEVIYCVADAVIFSDY